MYVAVLLPEVSVVLLKAEDSVMTQPVETVTSNASDACVPLPEAVTVIVEVPVVLPGVTVSVPLVSETVATDVFDELSEYAVQALEK